jgi:hypothetical protein
MFDPTLSASTGLIVDSNGDPISNGAGETLTYATLPAEVSMDASKGVGYLADIYGQAIVDVNGEEIPINKSVKSVIQDGAKNTYIVFEDGTVQQIGAVGGAGGSGGNGSYGGTGTWNPNLTSLYDQYIAATNSGDTSQSYQISQTLENYGVASSDFVTEAQNYAVAQMGTPSTTTSPTVPNSSPLGQFVNSDISNAVNSFGNAFNLSNIWDYLTTAK